MQWYTVIALDLEEVDTLMCHVEARDVDHAKELAYNKFMACEPNNSDLDIQYVFEGKLQNLCNLQPDTNTGTKGAQ